MKKIGLTLLTMLFVTGLMVGGAQAHWHGYYRGWWGPGVYLGAPIVVGPPLYPYGYYPPPVVVQEAPVYVQPQQEEPYYWYYCEDPKGYHPYIQNCPGGWMKVVPNTNPQTAPSN